MLKKSPYYAPIMLRAVPLCPKHASTILQLNTQLEYTSIVPALRAGIIHNDKQ